MEGGEEEEDEDEGEEEEDSDDEGEAKDDDFDAQQEEENERPKLEEGFYEIEAVRRKRIRKVSPSLSTTQHPPTPPGPAPPPLCFFLLQNALQFLVYSNCYARWRNSH